MLTDTLTYIQKYLKSNHQIALANAQDVVYNLDIILKIRKLPSDGNFSIISEYNDIETSLKLFM